MVDEKKAFELLKQEILKFGFAGSVEWRSIREHVLKVFSWDERIVSGQTAPSGYTEEERRTALTGFDIHFRKAMNMLMKAGLIEKTRHTRLKFRNGRILHRGRAVEFRYQIKAEELKL